MAFGFGNFGNMDDIFGNMDNMMNQMMGGMFQDPFAITPFGRQSNLMAPFNPIQTMMQQTMNMPTNGSSFVSSSFVSFSSNGNNPPQIYEETKMNHVGPGGVREERHTVRDSRTGLQKMKVGRHIQDRGHVIEKSKNHYTGDEEENNEYINLEEEEAPQFQQEWSNRMASHCRPNNIAHAITQGPGRSAPRLAITAGPSMAPTAPNGYHYQPAVQTCSTSSSPTNSSDNKSKYKTKNMKNKKPKKTNKKSE